MARVPGIFRTFKGWFLTGGLAAAAVLLGLMTGSARAAEGGDEPLPLCLPGIYRENPADCLPLGPSQYLTEMAEIGITFPQAPLPIREPDPILAEIPYHYAYVKNDRAPVYASLKSAVKENSSHVNRRTPRGFTYVAYTDRVYESGKTYYRTRSGWMSSKDLRASEIPDFQGLEFTRTPDDPFGWVLSYFSPRGEVETKRTPGYARDDYTGRYLEHFQVVTLYDQREVNGRTWYLVGPEEWIMQTAIAKVVPRTGPPEGFDWDRWIEVNLFEQTVAVYDQGELVFATVVASGDPPHWTYAGVFKIYEKFQVTSMQGRFPEDKSDNYYLEKVPWTMYYDEARAFHGAYWRASLGFPQSHGCINMTLGDSHWLYNWAEVGDRVYVHDPSGRTPEK
jgi:hypothetical protein